jgi:hypothetical protein
MYHDFACCKAGTRISQGAKPVNEPRINADDLPPILCPSAFISVSTGFRSWIANTTMFLIFNAKAPGRKTDWVLGYRQGRCCAPADATAMQALAPWRLCVNFLAWFNLKSLPVCKRYGKNALPISESRFIRGFT